MRKPIAEHASIWQSGEHVKVGLLPDQFFGLLLLSNVREQHHVPVQRIIVAQQLIDGDGLGVDLAVLAAVPHFAMPVTSAVDRFPHGVVEVLILAPRIEDVGALAEHFREFVSSNAGARRIDGDDVVIRIGDQHAFGSVLIDQRSQAAFFL